MRTKCTVHRTNPKLEQNKTLVTLHRQYKIPCTDWQLEKVIISFRKLFLNTTQPKLTFLERIRMKMSSLCWKYLLKHLGVELLLSTCTGVSFSEFGRVWAESYPNKTYRLHWRGKKRSLQPAAHVTWKVEPVANKKKLVFGVFFSLAHTPHRIRATAQQHQGIQLKTINTIEPSTESKYSGFSFQEWWQRKKPL